MIRILTCLLLLSACFPARLLSRGSDSVLYTGRFDFSGDFPVASHVSSSLKARFTGTGIRAELSAPAGTTFLLVLINGEDDPRTRKVLEVSSTDPRIFELASDLDPGEHMVELVKTNGYESKMAFHGFRVEGGSLLEKPREAGLRLEFYGDSNAEGTSAWDVLDRGFSSQNGGHYTYPGICSRLLDARYHNISMGGAGLTDLSWNLRNYYDRVHMGDSPNHANQWDFSAYRPDVVVINLGANDHYAGVSQAAMKKAWKDFIREDIRTHHPDAHVVLMNAWGWSFGEPADYLEEAVEEMHAEGETNVSALIVPWLWGQYHAVINEHAGFGSLLAGHIAEKLGLPHPGESEWSSLVPAGSIYNGSFESSILDGVADGWRPHGNSRIIDDPESSAQGDRYLELVPGDWSNHAAPASTGEFLAVGVMVRASDASCTAALKLEFKNQGQESITTFADRREVGQQWTEFTVSGRAPRGTNSAWIVLEGAQDARVCFDRVEGISTSAQRPRQFPKEAGLRIHPNPSDGTGIRVYTGRIVNHVRVYSVSGALQPCSMDRKGRELQLIFPENLSPGSYFLMLETPRGSQSGLFMVL